MKLIPTFLISLAASQMLHAAITLPAIIDNDMVLQRNREIPIYGTTQPGETITVSFAGQKVQGTADADGNWTAFLKPLEASATPREMTISGSETITLKNILVGDVWMASGQSNMELRLPEVINAQQEIANAKYETLRFFTVKRALASTPQKKTEGSWMTCIPANAPKFTAAGYFFARELTQRYGIPIAIINSAIGSAGAECYVPADVLRANPKLPQPLPGLQIDEYPDWETYDKLRMQVYNEGIYHDPGIKPECMEWSKPDYDDSDWKTMTVPSSIKRQGVNIDGTVWFRATVTLPDDWAGKNALLGLSFVQHNSIAYVNGTEVGRKKNNGAEWVPHNYPVPGELLHGGVNTIAVRITVEISDGGFFPPYPRPLTIQRGSETIKLTSAWKYKVEDGREPQQLSRNLPSGYRLPAALYNAMVAPYGRTPIRGVIWYQGESNAGNAPQHDILFPALINSWRKLWMDDLPFYFVQLPNYQGRSNDPNAHGGWAFFRESQEKALALSKTGMAVTIDIGEIANVHPRNKQDVGKRLAALAGHDCYGDTSRPYHSPVVKSIANEGDKLRVVFDFAYNGLKFKGDKLEGFAIAGADRKFVWAETKIEGNAVLVWSAQVPSPVHVRYAWGMNPAATLYNSADFPATPFRTDK